jgi:hypothetical protein
MVSVYWYYTIAFLFLGVILSKLFAVPVSTVGSTEYVWLDFNSDKL